MQILLEEKEAANKKLEGAALELVATQTLLKRELLLVNGGIEVR